MDEYYKPPSLYLPPPDVWLHNPYGSDLIPTPVDERGLVDLGELIKVMKGTVTPEYDWRSPFTDDHHLQWPNRWYQSVADSEYNPQRFRNLMISRADTPRLFHNWVHLVTEPPPVPDDDIIKYRIDAQLVAISLFKTAKTYSMLASRKRLSDAQLEKQLQQRFEDFNTKFELAKQTPKPFQLIDFDSFKLEDPIDMRVIRRQIGKYAFKANASHLLQVPMAA